MLEAILYILRVACPWRDLPQSFGPWSSVYTRWRSWTLSGTWDQILEILKNDAVGVLTFLDSTHVKVHQDATNAVEDQEFEGIGRTKGGLNSKVTAVVDSRGRATQLFIHPGNVADITAAESIEIPEGRWVVADKGYDSDAFRSRISQSGSKSSIPPMSNRKTLPKWHRGHYRRRHHVENFFQRIKRFRRISTRYEKHAVTFLAFVQLAAIMDWLKT